MDVVHSLWTKLLSKGEGMTSDSTCSPAWYFLWDSLKRVGFL